MSLIVGIETPRGVILGGDSMALADDVYDRYHQPKVWKVGPYVLGFAGSWRMGQLLRYSFQPPTPREGDEMTGFLVNRFIPRLIAVFSEGGLYFEKNEMENSEILLGLSGALFEIGTDFSVGRTVTGYNAIGSGSPFAIGSLCSTTSRHPKDRVYCALEAGEAHCVSVTSPFDLVEA